MKRGISHRQPPCLPLGAGRHRPHLHWAHHPRVQPNCLPPAHPSSWPSTYARTAHHVNRSRSPTLPLTSPRLMLSTLRLPPLHVTAPPATCYLAHPLPAAGTGPCITVGRKRNSLSSCKLCAPYVLPIPHLVALYWFIYLPFLRLAYLGEATGQS